MTIAPIPIRYTRTTETSLLVEYLESYDWNLFRDYDNPFEVGERVELERVDIEIVAVDDRGVPTRVMFNFDAPLEDDSFVWLEYIDLVPWPLTLPRFVVTTPPQVGESMILNEKSNVVR